jgi:hypothetical protein
MDLPSLAPLAAAYHWQLSLFTALGIAAVTIVGKQLVLLVPAAREAQQLN